MIHTGQTLNNASPLQVLKIQKIKLLQNNLKEKEPERKTLNIDLKCINKSEQEEMVFNSVLYSNRIQPQGRKSPPYQAEQTSEPTDSPRNINAMYHAQQKLTHQRAMEGKNNEFLKVNHLVPKIEKPRQSNFSNSVPSFKYEQKINSSRL